MKLQSVRGTKDYLFDEQLAFDYIIKTAKDLCECYCFNSISTPIFEFTEVFSRSLGEISDIVHKEMYSFIDKGGDSITLRPEFTASIARAFISNGLQQHIPIRLFSHGPVFRYERPQKGRQRQFHQINAEIIGSESATTDAELIHIAYEFLKKLKINDFIQLEINSLGCLETRNIYRNVLVEYFNDYANNLSEDSKIRLRKNPLRILDSKDEEDKKIIQNAPTMDQYFTNYSKEFFSEVIEYIEKFDVPYIINKKLVRGLDYYTHTAFEFTTNSLGAQNTVLAGGRYNGLIENLGGPKISAIGFASGIERLMLMLKNLPEKKRSVVIIPIYENKKNDDIEIYCIKLAQELRSNNISVSLDLYTNKIDKMLRKASKSNAKFTIFVGEEELLSSMLKIKNMDNGEENFINRENILQILMNIF